MSYASPTVDRKREVQLLKRACNLKAPNGVLVEKAVLKAFGAEQSFLLGVPCSKSCPSSQLVAGQGKDYDKEINQQYLSGEKICHHVWMCEFEPCQ